MATASPAAHNRQALRNALREALANAPAPESAEAFRIIADRPISNLPMSDLVKALAAMGIKSDRVLSAARDMAPNMAPDTDTDTDTNTDMDEDDGLLPPTDAENTEDNTDAETAERVAVDQEMTAIRSAIANGGFSALDERLRDLITQARKPPVIVNVPVEVPATTSPDKSVPQAAPTQKTVTWAKAFGVKGNLGNETATLWDGAHPDTPTIHNGYIWPTETVVALVQIKRGRNVWLWGPAGCGKTEFAQQVAARLGRPFVLISCDASTDAATLVGMTVPDGNGGVTFQPGQLVRAIQTPGAVICLDEPTIARPGALMVLQNVLTPNKALYIQETGQRIKCAPGVLFIATDNTNGTGGGSRRGFHGTQALNGANLDRFGARIKLSWPNETTEAKIIVAAVPGCTLELATLLVQAATTTRQAATNQTLTEGLGLRRLFAWAELLADGIDPELAFVCAVQNCVPEAEQEALRQQCILAVDKHTVARALNPQTAPTSRAAADFDAVASFRLYTE